ncbi:AAA family ATPase [Alistipes putredinis]|uniref:AAA family ATPase n=1 Tax=Alistipes putredinis TaxID=28117 RepID=UPI003A87F85C
MKHRINPFVISGYVSAEYFCDRKAETAQLIREVSNGNNVALISTRRMGKTGLIQHCFRNPELKDGFYNFFIDIYATKSLREFVFSLSRTILETLKPRGRKAMELFLHNLRSLQAGITFDVAGIPSFNVQLGDIQHTETTLDEIFTYLSAADKPCIVAIDEFQQIASYPEKNVEAMLRTYVQHCPNAHFIFAGSQRHTMGNMFTSPSRPFYQSVSMMHLESIDLDEYIRFARHHFEQAGKEIERCVVKTIYERFDGITWYIQKMLNALYSMTPSGGTCTEAMIDEALRNIVGSMKYTYTETLFRMPERQKELLIAISKEGRASSVTSGSFIKKYRLSSASSVQAAMKGLLEKDYITSEAGSYHVYDLFFGIWLRENY